MEHRSSVSGGSVSSCYDGEEKGGDDEDVVVVLDGLDDAACGLDLLLFSGPEAEANGKTGGELQRWDSVKSVGQLGRSNPEVDEYVCWGVAR